MKKYYYAVSCYYDTKSTFTENPIKGNFAFAETINEGNNILSLFNNMLGVKLIEPQPTRQAAEKLAAYWNDCYKKNGTYAYGA